MPKILEVKNVSKYFQLHIQSLEMHNKGERLEKRRKPWGERW